MTSHAFDTSPRTYARIGGVLYLMIIGAGIFGEAFVRGSVVVSGDATATANNIMASPLLWRIGILTDLLMHACDIPLMLILYALLEPVNKHLALLAILFNLIQTAILATNKLNLLTPLFLLGGTNHMTALEPRQLQALSYAAIRLHGYGFSVGLIFFGIVCLIQGYLIFTSGYFPKTLGVLMQSAGLCYLINSFSSLLAPAFAAMLFPAILLPAFLAELSFCLWLLVKGVNVPKWEETRRASPVAGA